MKATKSSSRLQRAQRSIRRWLKNCHDLNTIACRAMRQYRLGRHDVWQLLTQS